MQLEIGKTVARLRRERGITQEQVADAVGVSAPAVSKWETGQSYPDIALLPPLARFFHVSVDTLLAYQPLLTDEARDAVVDETNALFDAAGWDAGLARCEALLHEHPGDAKLRVALSSCLTRGAVYIPAGTPRDSWKATQEAWLTQALTLDDGEARPYAKYMLSFIYLSQQRLDEAEAMLTSLSDAPLNPRHLLPTLRKLQGRDEEAEKLSHENLMTAIGDAVTTLLSLVSLSVKAGNVARAKALADAAEGMLLPLGLERLHAFSIANAALITAHAANDAEALLDAAERLVHAVLNPGSPHDGSFFSSVKPSEPASPAHSRALREMLAGDFATGEYFCSVRGDPRFVALLSQLRGEEARPSGE